MLLKDGHEVCFAVADSLSQMFNGQLLLIVVVDIINKFTNFLILPVHIIRMLTHNVLVKIEEIDKFLQFGF